MRTCALSGFIAFSFLFGCGSSVNDDATESVTSTSEHMIEINTESGNTFTDKMLGTLIPKDAPKLPDYAPVYPGAAIKTRVASASSKEGSGSLIAMRTADPMEKVVAFYDLNARGAPSPPYIVTNDEDAALRIYADAESGEGTLVAISRDKAASGTVIVITHGKGKLIPKDEAEAAKVAASQGARLQ